MRKSELELFREWKKSKKKATKMKSKKKKVVKKRAETRVSLLGKDKDRLKSMYKRLSEEIKRLQKVYAVQKKVGPLFNLNNLQSVARHISQAQDSLKKLTTMNKRKK